MKKEFMVSKIEATQDGSPYVYIGFTDPNDYKCGEARQLNPFSPKVMGFSSPEDLMKNLPKAMKNVAGMIGGAGGLTDSPEPPKPSLNHSKSLRHKIIKILNVRMFL